MVGQDEAEKRGRPRAVLAFLQGLGEQTGPSVGTDN